MAYAVAVILAKEAKGRLTKKNMFLGREVHVRYMLYADAIELRMSGKHVMLVMCTTITRDENDNLKW